MKKFVIIKYNPDTGHRYVHSDGHSEKLYRDRSKAEIARLSLHLPIDRSEIIAVDSPAQAREYCRLRGEGLDHDTALKEAST